MKLSHLLATAVFALGMLPQTAAAQDWQQRRQWQQQQQQQQQFNRYQQQPINPYQQQPGRPVPQAGGGGGACVPSGFARLSRNCAVNTGACQRMPESCNRGWCCP